MVTYAIARVNVPFKDIALDLQAIIQPQVSSLIWLDCAEYSWSVVAFLAFYYFNGTQSILY